MTLNNIANVDLNNFYTTNIKKIAECKDEEIKDILHKKENMALRSLRASLLKLIPTLFKVFANKAPINRRAINVIQADILILTMCIGHNTIRDLGKVYQLQTTSTIDEEADDEPPTMESISKLYIALKVTMENQNHALQSLKDDNACQNLDL